MLAIDSGITRRSHLKSVQIRASRPTWISIFAKGEELPDSPYPYMRASYYLTLLPTQNPEDELRHAAKLLGQQQSISIQFDIQDVPPTIEYVAYVSNHLEHFFITLGSVLAYGNIQAVR
ncbi:hypothetical protein PIIN_11303 [Serendipita indica DSM 11827]|uniref:Uncharacterized protein n=1 Tax=Serendipita indica (strain DSM 11827) TaxID=1109443 RepID=G4U183_SERID|nr:hypothetical protein PIIN_11303 [Serendipita indica DSM 11827]